MEVLADKGDGHYAYVDDIFNTWDLALAFADAAPRYQLAVTVAQYAEVLRASPWAQETSYRQVLGEAARIAELLPEDGEVQEFAQLVSRASQMAGG